MGLHLSVVMPVYNERHLVAESIRRVLAVRSEHIDALDLIVVNDGSTDGTGEIVRELAALHPDRITVVECQQNQGKGAAVRAGIQKARGSVTVIHDADLEYNPQDFAKLMVPFVSEGADAVYGSRFATGGYRRVLYYRHTLGNRLITFLCNLLTDLNLSDVSDDFRIEVELTFKLAKRGARIFEVPISYAGRSYEEGKKIGFSDALLALGAMVHWKLIDDLYDPDQYGSNILVALSEVPRFNRWMGDVLRPHVGDRVLEIGAGIGNITRTLVPRDHYTASDVNPHYLDYLRNASESRPYMEVRAVDLADPDVFSPLAGSYDTVICLNVLEHIPDEGQAVRNLHTALEPGGVAIVLVPQGPRLFGTLDEALGHQRRYTRESLHEAFEKEGFQIERTFDFNRTSVPGWWLNGKLLRRRHFSRFQLKVLDWLIWLVRRIDRFLPWHGASLIVLARRPAP
jgi:glycosyltransferase involved in cell wall biosynthesis